MLTTSVPNPSPAGYLADTLEIMKMTDTSTLTSLSSRNKTRSQPLDFLTQDPMAQCLQEMEGWRRCDGEPAILFPLGYQFGANSHPMCKLTLINSPDLPISPSPEQAHVRKTV